MLSWGVTRLQAAVDADRRQQPGRKAEQLRCGENPEGRPAHLFTDVVTLLSPSLSLWQANPQTVRRQSRQPLKSLITLSHSHSRLPASPGQGSDENACSALPPSSLHPCPPHTLRPPEGQWRGPGGVSEQRSPLHWTSPRGPCAGWAARPGPPAQL